MKLFIIAIAALALFSSCASAWKVVIDEYTGKRYTKTGKGKAGVTCEPMPKKVHSLTFTATAASKKYKCCFWGHKDAGCQPGLDDRFLSCKGKMEWEFGSKTGPANFLAYEVRCGLIGHSRTDPKAIHDQQVAAQGSCPYRSSCKIWELGGILNGCANHCGHRGAHHMEKSNCKTLGKRCCCNRRN
jgi:hypothetical protein